jgi:phospholipid-binding lipoprotein MlaA
MMIRSGIAMGALVMTLVPLMSHAAGLDAKAPASMAVKEGKSTAATAPVPSAVKSNPKVIHITAEPKAPVDYNVDGDDEVNDPLEGLNRGVYKFNEIVDDAVLQPVARGYRSVVPEYGRDRVGAALSNLNEPVTFLNTMLQGNVQGALSSFWRFVINTTLGVGGLFDTAAEVGLKPVKEDFGQTLGSWGAGEGAYVVLPVIGPSSVRDTVGMVVDGVANPFSYLATPAVVAIKATEAVDKRADLLDITDDIERTSLDPYSTVKSAYIQRRESLVEEKAE